MGALVLFSIVLFLGLLLLGVWWVSRPYPEPAPEAPAPPDPKSDYTLVREAEIDVDPGERESARIGVAPLVEPPCSHAYTCITCGELVVCTRCGTTLGRAGRSD